MQHTHRTPTKILFLTALLAMIAPVSVASAPEPPTEQEFVITAYYSPKPDQCCFVKGSYAADVTLNGKGTNGADGTEVYPGMAAAPKSYPFGTRIKLPGIGVVTVHDRGGAINVLDTGAHRLDLWMGEGEEGLARALAYGVRRVKGLVYPKGSDQPAEHLSFETFEAPLAKLKPFLTQETTLLALRPLIGTKGVSVEMLQEALRDTGYFTGSVTGLFGPITQQSLESFLRDAGLADEPSDRLTEKAAAYLAAAVERASAPDPLGVNVNAGSGKQTIANAQRTLRFLGYYKGRTNGVFDDRLKKAIVTLQKEAGLVATEEEPWAGQIGPKTQRHAVIRWERRLLAARANQLLDLQRVAATLEKKGAMLAVFLDEGDSGAAVKTLQKFLVSRGLLAADRATGYFGAETKKALIAYQVDRKIIKNENERGAGTVGPATLMNVRRGQRMDSYKLVRAKGWGVL